MIFGRVGLMGSESSDNRTDPQIPDTTKPSADTPQASADTPQASADTPQASADTPQASADTPQASADTPQASADTPQASADTPQAEGGDAVDWWKEIETKPPSTGDWETRLDNQESGGKSEK